jgi:hypothetical protein
MNGPHRGGWPPPRTGSAECAARGPNSRTDSVAESDQNSVEATRRRARVDGFAWPLFPSKTDWREYHDAVIEEEFKRLMFDVEDV